MNQKRQKWILVCLRSIEHIGGVPMGLGNGSHYRFRDVHPNDVDSKLNGITGGTVVTMSIPIINAFITYSALDARKRLWFIDDDGELGTVRQMTKDESVSFYRSYKAGIQHVSEILISKGLWR